MNRILGNTLTALVLSALAQFVYSDSLPIVNTLNGHTYQRFDDSMTWHEGEAFCESQGGHLVTITSQQEQDFVVNSLSQSAPHPWGTWLGGTDDLAEGDWKWVSRETWAFSNWGAGEPNDTGGEDFLHMVPIGTWNDNTEGKDPTTGKGGACLWGDVIDGVCGAGNFVEMSTVCEVSGVSFSSFAPRAELKLGPKANDDSYWVRGFLKLGTGSNGINPVTEPVTIKLGSFSYTVPANSFAHDGSSYFFKGPVGPSTLDVKIWPLSKPGTYWWKSCLRSGDLAATTVQPTTQLTIGDDQGQATFDVGYAKFANGKDGAKWVFPPAK